MAQVIATVNMKGGVGKSTATFNLSHALVSRGKRVLAIDADPQATLTFLFEQDERALQLAEKTLYYSLVMDKPLSSIVIPTTPALIPSSIILSKADRELMATVRYTSSILREKLREVSDNYDYIFIDCPPFLTILTWNALAAAHLVLVPVKTDLLSILGIPLLLREIEDIRARDNRGLQVLGVLPTMYNKQYKNDNETLESLRAILQEKQIPLLDPIPRSTKYDKAASNGKPLILSSSNAPGADVFYTLADKIINHHG